MVRKRDRVAEAIRNRIEGDLTIGEYNLSHDPHDDGKIWIYHHTGEGGRFDKDDLFKAMADDQDDKTPEEIINQFYIDNF